MKVGELRRMLEGLDPEMPILLEVQDEESNEDELRQAYLDKADVEIRCDGDPCLYLFGDTNLAGSGDS